MAKYNLTVDEEQLRVLRKALDLYARVGIAQFDMILEHRAWQSKLMINTPIETKNRVKGLLQEVKELVTGHKGNSGPSITKADHTSMLSYELLQVIDCVLKRKDGADIFSEPISWSKHPLATIEKIEEQQGE